MHDKAGFWTTVWQRLRPLALSQIVDFGQYLFLWAAVLGAHFIRSLMAASGIEQDILQPIAWLERWVFIASFVSFFWRVLVRLYESVRTANQ
jgi:hypothetical protein